MICVSLSQAAGLCTFFWEERALSEFVQRRDTDFVLFEMLEVEKLLKADRYCEHDRASISAMLDSTESIARKSFLPLATRLDANEPKFIGGRVEIIDGVNEALAVCGEAGLFATIFDEADGGLQLPGVVSLLASGMLTCANLSIANYMFLTVANANMLRTFGSVEQRRMYMAPMLEGRWFGTMCLSETQAGSSLSDITTRAEPLNDGTYRIVGSKMWISGGDHELSENIIHMVLARIPGAVPGVKGISLFIVPRYRVDTHGDRDAWNHIGLGGVNHKMGQRGTVNCLLNFSEGGDSIGTIVGEVGRGMAYMFHMMNEARLGVGHAAAMCGLGGYLHSLHYARQRLQGRHPQDKNPTSPQVPIIEHADVKRMLMAQKSAVEGAMALTAYCAYLVDLQKVSDDAQEKALLERLLGILTPVAKSWPSEHCLEANKHAIQILGGYGYTREFPVERFYRDNRLNPIHEGTFGIQGLDLLGRKVRLDDGAGLVDLERRIGETIRNAETRPALTEHARQLSEALRTLRSATNSVLENNDVNLGLANATIYLDAFGNVVIAWLWLWQAMVALQGLETQSRGIDDITFYRGKLAACTYFYRYELPKVYAAFDLVKSLDDTCHTFDPAGFCE